MTFLLLKPANVRRNFHRACWIFVAAAFATPQVVYGEDDDVSNEYRLVVPLSARISDDISDTGTLGFFGNPDEHYQTYRVIWPDITYTPRRWLQLSGGLLSDYTYNRDSADNLELRPFAGVKLFIPNNAKLLIYNFTRYEYRATENLETHDWDNYSRIRSQFGIEAPLCSRKRAWQPGTWYAAASIEPFYRFDTDQLNPLRFGGGIGRVLHDRVRVELSYLVSMTRPHGGGLAWTENIIQLNVRIGLHEGILSQLHNPTANE